MLTYKFARFLEPKNRNPEITIGHANIKQWIFTIIPKTRKMFWPEKNEQERGKKRERKSRETGLRAESEKEREKNAKN